MSDRTSNCPSEAVMQHLRSESGDSHATHGQSMPRVRLQAVPTVPDIMDYSIQSTPFGECVIAMSQGAVWSSEFLSPDLSSDALSGNTFGLSAGDHPQSASVVDDPCRNSSVVGGEKLLQSRWPQTHFRFQPSLNLSLEFSQFQPGSRLHSSAGKASEPLLVRVRATPFQLLVWRSLLTIPLGSVATYQHIAQHIDKPAAARAVGSAIGKNPVGILIPCHRVVRASGALGGYRWGLNRKQAMLDWETHCSASAPITQATAGTETGIETGTKANTKAK